MSVKVVVAVGNRKIERCIARMEAIDVLTTVRKREAVLDAVINYNPHAVILSRELSGKTEMTDVIQRCRNLKECSWLIKKQQQKRTRTASPAAIPYSRGKIAEQAAAVKGKMNGAYCAAL